MLIYHSSNYMLFNYAAKICDIKQIFICINNKKFEDHKLQCDWNLSMDTTGHDG
jgi:hypothetical protein